MERFHSITRITSSRRNGSKSQSHANSSTASAGRFSAAGEHTRFVSLDQRSLQRRRRYPFEREAAICSGIGADLMAVLEARIDFVELLRRKKRHASQTGRILFEIHEF
jgi:hypothetical protein